MKYCPFIYVIEQVNQTTHEYDSDGKEKTQQHKLVEVQNQTMCKGRDCGVYRFGTCRRKS